MTHEELLAKFPLGSFYTNDQLNGMLRSIRAVVELHKPGRTAMVTGEVVCDGCDAGDNYYSNFYPCPTIQAIEKELM